MDGGSFSFKELDRWEARTRAEAEEEDRRQAAEDAWVDGVVAEQERLEAQRKAQAAAARASAPSAAPAAATRAFSGDDQMWQLALAPFGLALSVDAECGRGLTTARAFRAGEELLRVAPTVAVLSEDHVGDRCHHCLAAAASLKRCSGCQHARYCCAAHQRAAWRHHREECAVIKATRPRVLGPTLRLLGRALNLPPSPPPPPPASEAASAVAAAAPGAWAAGSGGLMSLRAPPELLEGAGRAEELAEQAQMFCALLAHVHGGGGGSDGGSREGSAPAAAAAAPRVPPPRLASEVLARLATNGVTVTDEELQPVGIGVYGLAALANHACRPTAAQTFDAKSGELVLRALAPLAAGAAVTVAYIDVAQPVAARRAALRSTYGFTCRCERCAAADAEATKAAAGSPADIDMAADADAADAAAVAESTAATLAAIDVGAWTEALTAAEAGLAPALRLHPAASPPLGLLLLRLAKLRAHVAHEVAPSRKASLSLLQGAVDAYMRAAAILCVSHGNADVSPLVSGLLDELDGARRELQYGPGGVDSRDEADHALPE